MIGDAIAVIGLLKDSLQWTELEPLQVDDKWLDLAKEKNVVRADGAYRWSDNDKVETRRLEDETLQDAAVKLRRLGAYVEQGQPARLLAGALGAVERAVEAGQLGRSRWGLSSSIRQASRCIASGEMAG
jgi:hypothetical protein